MRAKLPRPRLPPRGCPPARRELAHRIAICPIALPERFFPIAKLLLRVLLRSEKLTQTPRRNADKGEQAAHRRAHPKDESA